MTEEKRNAIAVLKQYIEVLDSPGAITNAIDTLIRSVEADDRPLDMLIFCPNCGKQHVDKPELNMCVCGDGKHRHLDELHPDVLNGAPICSTHPSCDCTGFRIAWNNPPHKSHKCHGCGAIFRIADIPTNGVEKIQTRGENDTYGGSND